MEQNNSNNSSQPSTLVFSISSNDNTNPLLAKSKEVTGTHKRKKNSTEGSYIVIYYYSKSINTDTDIYIS